MVSPFRFVSFTGAMSHNFVDGESVPSPAGLRSVCFVHRLSFGPGASFPSGFSGAAVGELAVPELRTF